MTSIHSKPSKEIDQFISQIWSHYHKHRRDFPWRNLDWKSVDSKVTAARSYRVVVSEIMLQQTQASRVVAKYEHFIERFPDWRTLAKASTADVLNEWQGLGYNRRALYLKRTAEIVVQQNDGRNEKLPNTYEGLRELPGIGPNTAGSILAFAFNIAHPFIETNIRSVFIHFFFPDIERKEGKKACKKIRDDEIMPFIERALADPKNRRNPREWYYALMDYGAMLKKQMVNPSRKSAHHLKQSTFKGSNRELRAELVRSILKKSGQTADDLIATNIAKNNKYRTRANILKNLANLESEGFITKKNSKFSIKK